MSVFSHRNGYNINNNQIKSASNTLKARIWARFYKQEFDVYDTINWENYTTGIEDMMIEMGIPYDFPENKKAKISNANKLRNYLIQSNEWYVIFDFIEHYLHLCDEETKCTMTEEFNRILQDEVSAYRIVDNLVVPITNESELLSIKNAQETKYDVVNTHMAKAVELYADRKKPDYENSIKESISAVESICCIITGQSGAKATLGKTIRKLKDNGIHIHSALENAFSSLFGYTSDESGIRHGGIDFANAPSEDAKFMLVTCSAFINYLTEKISKIK